MLSSFLTDAVHLFHSVGTSPQQRELWLDENGQNTTCRLIVGSLSDVESVMFRVVEGNAFAICHRLSVVNSTPIHFAFPARLTKEQENLLIRVRK